MNEKLNYKKVKKKMLKSPAFYFLIFIFFFVFFIFFNIFAPVSYYSFEEQTFLIKKGDGLEKISNNLAEEGLIRWPALFSFYVFILGEEGNLKAGRYILSKSMSVEKMAEIFISGSSIKDEITIQEGWDLRDIARHLESKGISQKEEIFKITGFPALDYSDQDEIPFPDDFSKEFSFLADKPGNISLEGYLYPDTYEFSYGDVLEDIIMRMLSNFGKKLNEENLSGQISASGKSLFEIITMASILEKEVIGFEDKKIASGVLWKRLEIGMPLQTDACVNYATGKDSRKIPISDTKEDSLYNTYKHKGLPLGPISNPGIESIKAALEPEQSPYLYYLSTPDRKTIFSKTLEEHNIAKAKYLK